MNEVQQFIKNVINAAKKQEATAIKELQELIRQRSLTVRFANFNAIHQLGRYEEWRAMKCIINATDQLELWNDFAAGLAYQGKQEQALFAAGQSANPNYAFIAAFAAFGNQREIAEFFLNKITNVTYHHYNIIAAFAALGGYQYLVERFLNKITTESQRNYNMIAAGAAMNGHKYLAEMFLNKITDPTQRDYNEVAAWATYSGHQHIAEHFLNKVDKKERDYHKAAVGAAEGGHQSITEYFLNQITAKTEYHYNIIAAWAAKGGHQALAKTFLNKITAPNKRDYDRVAAGAAYGGHQYITEYFLSIKLSETPPDFERVAAWAAKGGHQVLAKYFLSEFSLLRTPPQTFTPSVNYMLSSTAPTTAVNSPPLRRSRSSIGVITPAAPFHKILPQPHAAQPAAPQQEALFILDVSQSLQQLDIHHEENESQDEQSENQQEQLKGQEIEHLKNKLASTQEQLNTDPLISLQTSGSNDLSNGSNENLCHEETKYSATKQTELERVNTASLTLTPSFQQQQNRLNATRPSAWQICFQNISENPLNLLKIPNPLYSRKKLY